MKKPVVESFRSPTRLATFATTELQPCPYLADRDERRLFTMLHGQGADARHDLLVRAGFRRSQNVVYRPICPSCTACRSVRVPVETFQPSRNLRKVAKRNAELEIEAVKPRFTDEHFLLFRRYVEARHGEGSMAEMERRSFHRMIESSPVTTHLLEFRTPQGDLIAASLTDEVASGLSGVYKYFDPTASARSLGTYIILAHIQEARRRGLPYVYLGYWIEQSPKMAYKGRFRPLEVLVGSRWLALENDGDEEAKAV